MDRDGNAVIGKDDNANGAALQRDVVNIKLAVVLDGGRELLEISGQLPGIKPADKDLGKTRFESRSPSATSPILGIMHGKGGLVQVSFELEACLLDEFLVLRIPRNRGKLVGCVEGPNPVEIDIQESIRPRQQPGRLGGSVLAELDDRYHSRRQQEHGDQDREGTLDPHGGLTGMAS